MKVLFLDIETAPNKVYCWGLWNQNISINQIVEPGYTICFAAKWENSKKIHFHSMQKNGIKRMVKEAHKLLEEADAVVHYNGKKFDIPTLNREFLLAELQPPSGYSEVDLYSAVKKKFRFASNKLDYVSSELGIGNKVQHKGMGLWTDCMDQCSKGANVLVAPDNVMYQGVTPEDVPALLEEIVKSVSEEKKSN